MCSDPGSLQDSDRICCQGRREICDGDKKFLGEQRDKRNNIAVVDRIAARGHTDQCQRLTAFLCMGVQDERLQRSSPSNTCECERYEW